MEDSFGFGPEISAIGIAAKRTAILGLLRSGWASAASGARSTASTTASPIRRMSTVGGWLAGV